MRMFINKLKFSCAECIDNVAQKGPTCFFLLRSKLVILVNVELNIILCLSWFYQVSMLQKNKFRKFVGIPTTLIMVINKRVKHSDPWKNKIGNPMIMSKRGQNATLALLTFELCLTMGPNCLIIIYVKVKCSLQWGQTA